MNDQPNALALLTGYYAGRDVLRKALGKKEYDAKVIPIRPELRRLMTKFNWAPFRAAEELLAACPEEQRGLLRAFVFSAACDIDSATAKANLAAARKN